jgi:ABC-type polysaccharide/polyol phosphate transport system ATPase subunit
MAVIEITKVSKRFQRHVARKLIREQIGDLFRRSTQQHFYALRDITFQVHEAESVAVIGANGAGKSTLLTIIAGLCMPDEGQVKVHGRVAPLLELGSGFHGDLTGTENILVNAALLGFHKREAMAKLPEIVEFAELGDFINEPIRTYSTGMTLRLAFSVAVHVDPSILIVDEVLGVGDSHFQEKCVRKIQQLRSKGTTLLCVSHSSQMVVDFCSRAIWLNHGEMQMDGEAKSVLNAYAEHALSNV